ncbi:MAG: zinc finger domain-containing protein [Alphaproteobacteria bacterium]
MAVEPTRTTDEKCDRCWRHLPNVGSNPEHPDLCGRCADAVNSFSQIAK